MKRPRDWDERKKEEEVKDWTEEFIDESAGKRLFTKEEYAELKEKYKEKYGEYPPELGTIEITNY